MTALQTALLNLGEQVHDDSAKLDALVLAITTHGSDEMKATFSAQYQAIQARSEKRMDTLKGLIRQLP